MRIGFIGLGKMGGNMVARLLAAGHETVVLDKSEAAVEQAVKNGATAAMSREDLFEKLPEQKIVWMMIPSQFVDTELTELIKIAPKETIIVDGGNSDFRLTQQRGKQAAKEGVYLVDVGTSGGILGREKGYAMMVGGDVSAVEQLTPIFDALAPKDGWNHFGETGTGHYVKMIHNGIEYGMMQSFAEGYHLLKEGPIPDINLSAVGKVWQNGSIVDSLLNTLTTEALEENPELEGIDGYVTESGEARWTLETAKAANIPTPSIQASMDVRLASQRGEVSFATKLLAAMRNKFGGHAINGDK